MITIAHYQLTERFCRGRNSSFYYSKTPSGRDIVVRKTLKGVIQKETHQGHSNTIKKFQNSDYIVNYIDSYEDKLGYYLALERLSGKSPVDLLQPHKEDTFYCYTKIMEIARDILKGLKECHDAGIIHSDIKNENIMYDEASEHMKLIDFDLATNLPEGQDKIKLHLKGTFPYMPPEVLCGGYFSKVSDSWSFGVLMYSLMYRKYPFKMESQKMLKEEIATKEPLFRYPEELPELFVDIIRSCLNKDPSKRPTPEQMLEHPIFKNMK